MNNEFSATAQIEIAADISLVWDALVNPAIIAQYFFGTHARSDWKVGSPLVFSGVWDGKEYEDKGVILRIEAPHLLQYNYWSSFSGTEDIPENYSVITYTLHTEQQGSLLRVQQDGIKTDKAREHSEQSWKMVLNNLKHLLEKEAQTV